MARARQVATLRMPSGEQRYVQVACMATIGQVGNLEHENVKVGKAVVRGGSASGRTFAASRDEPGRPPDGRCEASRRVWRHPCTPWGVPTKGHKTRQNRRTDKYIVKRRGKGR